ncbi:hypothetical protein BHM03_00059419 [Ensete ventricosum]|nr:hypothetical protein BHM03_00059419 [Ensete ventricosum]
MGTAFAGCAFAPKRPAMGDNCVYTWHRLTQPFVSQDVTPCRQPSRGRPPLLTTLAADSLPCRGPGHELLPLQIAWPPVTTPRGGLPIARRQFSYEHCLHGQAIQEPVEHFYVIQSPHT